MKNSNESNDYRNRDNDYLDLRNFDSVGNMYEFDHLRAKGALPNATPVIPPLTETNVTKDTLDHLETEEQWNYTSRYDSVKGGFSYNMKLAWLCMLGSVGYAFNALFPTLFTTLGLRKVTKAYSKEWYARYGHLVGSKRPPLLCDVEVWRLLNINRSFQENNDEIYAD